MTESRAVGTNAWKVTGSAYIGSGTTGGGELTAIAYCSKAKRRILTEVASTPVAVSAGMNAAATTPSCPGRLRLTTTGFALDSPNAFYVGQFAERRRQQHRERIRLLRPGEPHRVRLLPADEVETSLGSAVRSCAPYRGRSPTAPARLS